METAGQALYRDKRRARVWELDFLRGVAVIAMCFDHLMFDFSFLPWWFENYYEVGNSFIIKLNAFADAYWDSTYSFGFRFWAHHLFVFLFLFLVGTSCAFSRDNVRRGAGLGVVAMAFTGISFVLKAFGIMEDGIVFGILDCIALSILCAAAVDIATKKCKPLNLYLPLILGVAICGAGIGVKFWNLGVPFDDEFTTSHLIGYIMGTRGFGDDWFGLFPYVGAVLIGMYFGKAFYAERRSILPRLDGKWNKPINFVGRHALIFYIAHQVMLAGLVGLVCLCLGYRF